MVAAPGEILTVENPGIVAGAKVQIILEAPNGYTATVHAVDVQDGVARFGVPPIVDPATGDFVFGEVSVTVVGIGRADAPLSIGELPSIEMTRPGRALEILTEIAVDEYRQALAEFTTMGEDYGDQLDVSETIALLNERILSSEALITELRTTGQLVSQLLDGTPVTLTATELAITDRWVVAMFDGALKELGATDLTLDTMHAKRSTHALLAKDSPEEAEQWLKNAIQKVKDGVSAGLEGGKVLLGVLSTGLTVVGAVAATGTTAPAWGTAGIVVGLAGVTWSFGSSLWARANPEAFNSNNGQDFNVAQEGAALGIEIGSNYIPGMTPLNALVGATNTINAAVNLKCYRDQNQKQRQLQTIPDAATFCAIVAPTSETQDEGEEEPDGCSDADVCRNGDCGNCGCEYVLATIDRLEPGDVIFSLPSENGTFHCGTHYTTLSDLYATYPDAVIVYPP